MSNFQHTDDNMSLENNPQKDNPDASLSAVEYHLDFSRLRQHLVDVTLTFTADQDAPVLWLPAWIPGSYLIRDHQGRVAIGEYDQGFYMASGSDKWGMVAHWMPIPEFKQGE